MPRRTRVHRYKELHLGQLRAFLEVARRKNFSAAARSLKLSQAAVWQQVRALERDLDAALFDRRGRELHPTEDGYVLIEIADTLLGAADSLQTTFSDRRAKVARNLVVVGSPGVHIMEMVRPVADFRKANPLVKITLTSNAGSKLVDSIFHGDADLAILPDGWPEVRSPELIAQPLCDRPAVVAVPEGHPLERKRRIGLADLSRYPLIMVEPGNLWRNQVDAEFSRAGLSDRLQIALEGSMAWGCRAYVAEGLGIGLYPQPRCCPPFPGVTVRPLDHLFPSERLNIYSRRGTMLRPQARMFVDFVTERLHVPRGKGRG
jgi:DNA-binding transcriptional LysR family regulator